MTTTLYLKEGEKIVRRDLSNIQSAAEQVIIWIDAYNMSPQESEVLNSLLSINAPSHSQMKEIELSNRIYQQDDAIFMTTTLMTSSTSTSSCNCTFILKGDCLVTIHHCNIPIIARLAVYLDSSDGPKCNGRRLFVEAVKYALDFLADTLEQLGYEFDDVSTEIFWPSRDQYIKGQTDYNAMLRKIGQTGDLLSKAHDSLVTLIRILSYGLKSIPLMEHERDILSELEISHKDAEALRDHTSFLSSKVEFLLNATLGMINIDQNSIIKIVSVAAVVFLPPTVIASIYGMNFAFMPILQHPWGYPAAICAMILSSALPYIYFKWRKWL